MYKKVIKRLLDIIISSFGILFLAFPMIIIAIAIKCESNGPVFFKQTRVGLHKKNFEILKFRSMRTDAPPNSPTYALTNSEIYITKIGVILRKTSLDELPQLFNIFLGQMSIIGPRPVIVAEQDLISERDKYGANDVLPGLTGWAQINGRDELDAPTKARYDGEYVNNISFLFDCKCFIGTIAAVLKRDGVVEGSDETAANHDREKESTTVQK